MGRTGREGPGRDSDDVVVLRDLPQPETVRPSRRLLFGLGPTFLAGAPGGKSRGGRPRAPRRNLGNQDLNCFDSFWSTWCTKRVVKRRAPDVNPAERESAQLVDFALRFDFVLHTASSAIYQSRGRKNTGSSQTLKDRGGGGALSRVAAVAVGPFGGRGARVPLRSREDKVGVRQIARARPPSTAGSPSSEQRVARRSLRGAWDRQVGVTLNG